VLVIEDHEALALKLSAPERVLSTIPTAQTITAKGKQVVVLPHKLDEVRVLNNLGFDAPSPILHYYNWPGNFTPYEHQKQTAAFLTLNPKALVLNEIGTGKTASALWAADYLMELGFVRKCLIISPLSTLQRVWNDAIFKGFPNRTAVVLHGTAAKRKKLLNTENDFYIINHDGFNIIADDVDGMFDLVIVDEAAVLRNPQTTRFKKFRKFIDNQKGIRLWLMTGTPTPNEPTDAWALARLVDSPFLPRTYTAFRDLVMTKSGMHSWVARPNAIQTVHHVLHPAVRYKRDDCFDLPDTIVQTREVELSKEQKEHYKRMLRQFITGVEGGETITAVNEAVKLQKLVQIACGVAYADDGSDVELDAGPRVSAVKEIVEEAGEKIIIFVPLTGTLNMLERELSKHWSVAVVNGAVASSKRDKIFHEFQENDDPRILIAHPATMAHGLTLTAASTIIWYGPITSNEQYTQANGRIERIGKTHHANVVHIEGTTLERDMYKRLKNKQKLQGLLLDLIENERR
jgi:SNF2 family DNA or RNA helicase